jgi:hypothetical protein
MGGRLPNVQWDLRAMLETESATIVSLISTRADVRQTAVNYRVLPGGAGSHATRGNIDVTISVV